MYSSRRKHVKGGRWLKLKLNRNWDSMFVQGALLAFQEFTSTTDLHEITHEPHIGCCLLEMFTEVIVIFWFSRIAVLKNINVRCSCGNLYNDIITCNIILYTLTFTKNRWPRGYDCWMVETFQQYRLNFILSLIRNTSAYSFLINACTNY